MFVSKTPTEYKLEELARAAGVSPRTVRYYVQRGLLPAPAFRGKDTAYAPMHLLRLRAIKKLQDAFLPLDAIAVTLASSTDHELEEIAKGRKTIALVAPQAAPHPKPVHTPSAERVERYTLADGVELLVAGNLKGEAKDLVAEILKTATKHGGTR